MQAPALHTCPAPQTVPSVSAMPVSAQAGRPVVQETAPAWQGFAGAQLEPGAQAPHWPPWQNWPGPQGDPSARSTPESAQTEAPVEQLVAPAWQAFGGVQGRFAGQSTQAPAAQTLSTPQIAPVWSGVPVSKQPFTPAVQVVRPA
jgi:hypothetical protein